MSGEGIYTFADGYKYIGLWENAQRHGFGTLFDEDGLIEFSGIWNNGKRESDQDIEERKTDTIINIGEVESENYSEEELDINNEMENYGEYIYMTDEEGNIFDGIILDKEKDIIDGTITMISGSTYIGQFNYNVDGFGVYTDLKNMKYMGEFKSGVPMGNCKVLKNDKLIIDGDFVRGVLISGVKYYSDNSKYDGEFKNNTPHGRGTFLYSNGGKYIGDIFEGRRHGHGALYCDNGDVYEGNFNNGKADGQGVILYADGIKYEGEFKNFKRHGMGKIYFTDGRVEMSNWEENKRVK